DHAQRRLRSRRATRAAKADRQWIILVEGQRNTVDPCRRAAARAIWQIRPIAREQPGVVSAVVDQPNHAKRSQLTDGALTVRSDGGAHGDPAVSNRRIVND